MRFLDRIATLIKADAHGVVESLEDRGLLLKQYVREAELELDRKRARCEALGAEAERLEKDIERFGAEIRAMDEDITLTLGRGKEDLARFAIRKLIPLRADVERSEARLVDVRAEHGSLGEKLGTQEQELETLKARARSYLASRPRDGEPGDPFAATVVSDEEVEMELLRRQRSAQKGAA